MTVGSSAIQAWQLYPAVSAVPCSSSPAWVFHGCSQLSDAVLAALAGGLSSTLLQRCLNLRDSWQLSDAGLVASAGGLSCTRQELILNFELFGEGLQLGGAGLAALADGFSSTLRQSRLYFRSNHQLSDAGGAGLAGGLSNTLQ